MRRTHTRSKPIVALVTTIAVLVITASPASAAVVTGEVVDGRITLVAYPGLPAAVIELDGTPVHPCDAWWTTPTLDVDLVGNGVSGTTEIVAADLPTTHVDISSVTFALDISLDVSGWADQTGVYSGGGSSHTVAQNVSLVIDFYETAACVPIDHACRLQLTGYMTGSFTGTISPPASGSVLFDGDAVQDVSSCDILLALMFNGFDAIIDDLTVVF